MPSEKELKEMFLSRDWKVKMAKAEVSSAFKVMSIGRWRAMWEHVRSAERLAHENDISLEEIGLSDDAYKLFREAPEAWQRMLDTPMSI